MADQAADGVNWDWWQEFTSQATGIGDDLHAVDHRLRGHARQHQQRARRAIARSCRSRRPSLPTCWSGSSCPAACSIATRGSGRRARTASSPPPACSSGAFSGSASSRDSSTGSCSPTSTRGCSTSGSSGPTRDLDVERTAFFWRARHVRDLRRAARRGQRGVRLREGAAGRGRPAQRARRACGVARVHRPQPGRRARAVRAERDRLPAAACGVGVRRARARDAPGCSMWLGVRGSLRSTSWRG